MSCTVTLPGSLEWAIHRVVKIARSKPGFIEEVTAERDRNEAHRA